MYYILMFIAGFLFGSLSLLGYFFYEYCKALKEAYEEGWDV